MLFDARARDRLFDSEETELERRLGSLLGGEKADAPLPVLGDEGDSVAAEMGVGVVLPDTGDQVSGKEGLEVVCETVLGREGA